MKLCGCNETCFVNGEKAWGRHGAILCLHAGERDDNGIVVAVCDITDELVTPYTSDWQHKRIKARGNYET